MKYIRFQAIIFCFCLIALNYSCEKAELQKSIPNDAVQVDSRGDCQDCPGADECCCVVEWLSGDPGYFRICGTSDGDATTCEIDPSPCEYDIDGLQHSMFYLDTDHRIHDFCMDENTAFQVYRFSIPMGTSNVRINCKRNQLNPIWVIESLTDEDRSHYDVDGSCNLDGPCGG